MTDAFPVSPLTSLSLSFSLSHATQDLFVDSDSSQEKVRTELAKAVFLKSI